mmetsp:Transcript_38484/g.80705  ORF Transcript_38484/g.80705 Transcript_38484/m.80705 type:complete len:216 (-) Transcript_38484:87-734(-)
MDKGVVRNKVDLHLVQQRHQDAPRLCEGELAADALPAAREEGDPLEGVVHPARVDLRLEEALRDELLGPGPEGRVVAQHDGRQRHDGAGRDRVAAQHVGLLGDAHCEGGGGVEAQGLLDDRLGVGHGLEGLGRDAGGPQGGPDLLQHARARLRVPRQQHQRPRHRGGGSLVTSQEERQAVILHLFVAHAARAGPGRAGAGPGHAGRAADEGQGDG